MMIGRYSTTKKILKRLKRIFSGEALVNKIEDKMVVKISDFTAGNGFEGSTLMQLRQNTNDLHGELFGNSQQDNVE